MEEWRDGGRSAIYVNLNFKGSLALAIVDRRWCTTVLMCYLCMYPGPKADKKLCMMNYLTFTFLCLTLPYVALLCFIRLNQWNRE